MANKASGGGGGSGVIRAGAAFVELFADDSKLQRTLAQSEKRTKAFGVTMVKAGGATAGAGASLLGGMAGIAGATVEHATGLSRLAGKLGVTVEEMSAMAYAASTAGVSVEELEGHFENFAERVAQAANGTGEAAETFQKLGINANQLIKQSTIDQIDTLADSMLGVTNSTERLGMLSQFGGDQFQKLNVILKGGSAGLRELKKEAADTGAILTGEQAERAMEAQRNLNRVWTAAKSILFTLGDAILQTAGPLSKFVPQIVKAVASVRSFVVENREVIGTVAGIAAGLVAAGAALMGFGTFAITAGAAVGAVSSAIGVAVGGFGLLLSAAAAIAPVVIPILALAVAIGAAGYALYEFTDAGRAVASDLGQFFGRALAGPIAYVNQTVETFKTTWGGIRNALLAGDLALAGRVALAGLNVEFRRGVLLLVTAWSEWGTQFVDRFYEAVMGAELALNDGIAYIRTAFFELTSYLLQQWDSFGTTIGSILTRAAEVGTAAMWQYVLNTVQGLKLIAAAAGLDILGKTQAVEVVAAESKAVNQKQIAVQQDLISKALGAGKTAAEIEAERKAAEARIRGDAEKDKGERNRADMDRVANAAADLARAQQELADLIGQAVAPDRAANAVPLKKVADATGLQPVTGTLGAFATGGIAKQLFGTGDSVAKQQLQVQRGIGEMLDKQFDQNAEMLKLLDKMSNRKGAMLP